MPAGECTAEIVRIDHERNLEMRIVLEIGGVILLINGVGGLVKDDFGLLARVADGGASTGLSMAAIVVGAVLVGASLLSRKSDKASDA